MYMVNAQRELSIKNIVNQRNVLIDSINISFIFLLKIVSAKTTSPKNTGKLLFK